MIGRKISHYKVLEKVGEGGMGVVYKAEDTKLGRTVALKFLAAHLLKDAESRKRFEREAKAVAALNHPNICTIHEIDEAEGRTFLALEFIEGESLQARIERGPLPLEDALDLARQTADGLEAAHEKGVVHRDIKPGNLLITPKGQLKILDFGLALLTEGSKLTQLDTTLGTIAYMSPEQTMAADTDNRTDIWALGVVLYEMVSGRLPFRGDYDRAVMYSITSEEPEPLTALRTGVPMELEWLINKCLAKQPDGRYQNAADLIVDLTALRKKMEAGKSTIVRPLAASTPVGTGNPAGPNIEPLQAPHSAPAATPQTPAATVTPGSTFGPYRVIEDLGSGGEIAAYRAEDTQLRRSVTINVLPESAARRAEQRARLKLVGTAVFFALAVVLILLSWTRQSAPIEPASVRRFAFTPEDFRGEAAISPNGKHIVYLAGTGQSTIWVRDLDSEQPRELPGTAGASDWGAVLVTRQSIHRFRRRRRTKKDLGPGRPGNHPLPTPRRQILGRFLESRRQRHCLQCRLSSSDLRSRGPRRRPQAVVRARGVGERHWQLWTPVPAREGGGERHRFHAGVADRKGYRGQESGNGRVFGPHRGSLSSILADRAHSVSEGRHACRAVGIALLKRDAETRRRAFPNRRKCRAPQRGDGPRLGFSGYP